MYTLAASRSQAHNLGRPPGLKKLFELLPPITAPHGIDSAMPLTEENHMHPIPAARPHFPKTLPRPETHAFPPMLIARQDSPDGTRKLLLRFCDGQQAECVILPMLHAPTLCLSTQIGCALGCRFCCSGQQGFLRNLSAQEILGQAEVAAREAETLCGSAPQRIVFMGIGEPLLNFHALVQFLELVSSPPGLHISWRKIHVSTVGIPHRLHALGRRRLAIPAVSLHAPTQELRDVLMPGAKTWPIRDLIATLEAYPLPARKRLLIEYLLIKDVNDGESHARQLHDFLKAIRCKVTLLPCNPVPGKPFFPSSSPQTERFLHILKSRGQTVYIRRDLGANASAACGQLRAQHAPRSTANLVRIPS